MITVDTNVFIYAADDNAAPGKKETAALVLTRLVSLGAPIGLQVVGEFQNAARRKLGMTGEERARYGRSMLATFEVFPPSRAACELALPLFAKGRLSYWDALLLASAAEAGCHTLLSEDMGDGQDYFGVRLINPFTTPGGALSDAASEALAL